MHAHACVTHLGLAVRVESEGVVPYCPVEACIHIRMRDIHIYTCVNMGAHVLQAITHRYNTHRSSTHTHMSYTICHVARSYISPLGHTHMLVYPEPTLAHDFSHGSDGVLGESEHFLHLWRRVCSARRQ
jgi:hypothetical protein